MKQAVLYLTTKSNEWTLSAFHALEQSLQGMADVYSHTISKGMFCLYLCKMSRTGLSLLRMF